MSTAIARAETSPLQKLCAEARKRDSQGIVARDADRKPALTNFILLQY